MAQATLLGDLVNLCLVSYLFLVVSQTQKHRYKFTCHLKCLLQLHLSHTVIPSFSYIPSKFPDSASLTFQVGVNVFAEVLSLASNPKSIFLTILIIFTTPSETLSQQIFNCLTGEPISSEFHL